jgi:hypothetical protein
MQCASEHGLEEHLEEQQYGNPCLYWDTPPGLIERVDFLKPIKEIAKIHCTATSGAASSNQNAAV